MILHIYFIRVLKTCKSAKDRALAYPLLCFILWESQMMSKVRLYTHARTHIRINVYAYCRCINVQI